MELLADMEGFDIVDWLGQRASCRLRIYRGAGEAVVIASHGLAQETWARVHSAYCDLANKVIAMYGVPVESTAWMLHGVVSPELQEMLGDEFYEVELLWVPGERQYGIDAEFHRISQERVEEQIAQRFEP